MSKEYMSNLTETDVSKFQKKGKFKAVKGSIITPEHAGLRLIINFIDAKGGSEENLLPLLEKKWKKVKESAKGWYASRNNFKLGEISTVAVQSDTWIINCLCQGEDLTVNPKDLESCLKKVLTMAKDEKASIHVSNILTTNFKDLEPMLVNLFLNQGINVSLYEE